MMTTSRVACLLFQSLMVLVSARGCNAAALAEDPVTVLGLGKMGAAVVRCLSKNDRTVHAWNRGVEKREALRDVASVHGTAAAAVQASNVTMILIDDWVGTVALIADIEKDVWNGKTVVMFSTYTPTDIKKLHSELFAEISTTLVGGAIVGVPQTICSDKALLLTSERVPALENVGRTVAFAGDVGLAALANMAIILVITFGVAGQELAHLIFHQYGASEHFLDTYAPVSAEIGPAYAAMLLPMVSKAITSKQYMDSYVPVGVFRRVVQMIAGFMEDLGIDDDTFLATYLKSLEKVSNDKYLPAAWIEEVVPKVSNAIGEEL